MISKLRSLIGAQPQSSALAGILFMLGSVTIFSLANAFSKAMVATYPPAMRTLELLGRLASRLGQP